MAHFIVVVQWYEPTEDGGHYVAEQQVGEAHSSYQDALAACKREQRDNPDRPYTFRVREQGGRRGGDADTL